MLKRVFDFLYLIDVGYPDLPGTFASYLIADERVAIVDPGPARFADSILKAVEDAGLDPKDVTHILLTHIHLDHCSSVPSLLEKMPNARVYVHPRGAKHLVDPYKLNEATRKTLGDEAFRFIGEMRPVPPDRIVEVKDFSVIELGGNICLLALHTPGHASHHVAYFTDVNDVLFAGDMAGVNIRGYLMPSAPPPFKPELALESLRKVMMLRPLNVAFAHFGVEGNGFELLMRVYGRYAYWLDTIRSLLREGRKKEEVFDFLLRYDHSAREAKKVFEVNPFLRDSLRRSFEGFYGAVAGSPVA